MRAGRMHTRITFDKPTAVSDAAGGTVVTWVPVFTAWADVHPLTGRETTRTNQTIAELDTRIRIRYDGQSRNIDATWRARDVARGIVYNIVRPPINSDTRDRDLEILCSSGVNRG